MLVLWVCEIKVYNPLGSREQIWDTYIMCVNEYTHIFTLAATYLGLLKHLSLSYLQLLEGPLYSNITTFPVHKTEFFWYL